MTRDVALFMPFRVALGKPKQMVGLPTLMHHLMRRQIQMGRLDSVSYKTFSFAIHPNMHGLTDGPRSWKTAGHPSTFTAHTVATGR